jgi:hypothetical protein
MVSPEAMIKNGQASSANASVVERQRTARDNTRAAPATSELETGLRGMIFSLH